MNKYKKNQLVCFCLSLLFVSNNGWAGTLSTSINETVEFTDNVRRNATEDSDTISNTSVSLIYDNDSEKYPTEFNLTATRRIYLENTFDDQNVYFASLNSNLNIIRNRFDWTVDDRYRLVNINTLQSNTPINQEDTNYFSTGPDFYILNNSRSNLLMSFRYEEYYYEKSTTDRSDYLSTLRWTRNISRRTQLALQASVRESNYDLYYDANANTFNIDFRRVDYSVNLARTGRTSRLELEAGESVYKPDSGAERDASLVRAIYTDRIANNSDIDILYVRELTDTSNSLANISSENSIFASVTSSIFLSEQFRAAYNLRTSLGALRLEVSVREADYDDNQLDIRSQNLFLGFNFSSDNKLSYGVSYSYIDQEWPNRTPYSEYTENAVRGNISKRMGAGLRMDFSLLYSDRVGNTSQLSYDEIRAIFGINYNL